MTKPLMETVAGIVQPVRRTLRITHRAVQEYRGEDGFLRHIEVSRLEEGSIGIMIHTYWGGDDAEPLKTEFVLSTLAAEYIFQMGAAIRMNDERLRLPVVDVLAQEAWV